MPQPLALLGGQPIRATPFPDYPKLTERDIHAVTHVLRSGDLSTFHRDFLGGTHVRGFEKSFADWHQTPFAIAVNSGTAALHIALQAVGVGPGDEVIVPAFTFTATASAVCMTGARAVFADVDVDTFNISLASVEAHITSATKAVIPVHLLGNPADMDQLIKIAARHHLVIIEDCAQALGAAINGAKVGTMGQAGCFSFQETKTLSVGEGGMVISHDAQLTDICRLTRNHGEAFLKDQPRPYVSRLLGWNYRMTEMEAALARSRFSRLEDDLRIRSDHAAMLDHGIAAMPYLTPQQSPANSIHGRSLYGLRFDAERAGVSRERFLMALNAEGIPFRQGYPHPLYMNPIFSRNSVRCPNAEYLCQSAAIWSNLIQPTSTRRDVMDAIKAFQKIHEQLDSLRH